MSDVTLDTVASAVNQHARLIERLEAFVYGNHAMPDSPKPGRSIPARLNALEDGRADGDIDWKMTADEWRGRAEAAERDNAQLAERLARAEALVRDSQESEVRVIRERDDWKSVADMQAQMIDGSIPAHERLTRERDAAREALRKYGRHTHACRIVRESPPVPPCTCGLQQALDGDAT